jgi:hypothetical protein
VVGIAGATTQPKQDPGQNDAKAEVDHETLTYPAKLQDEQMTELKGIAEILRNLKNK